MCTPDTQIVGYYKPLPPDNSLRRFGQKRFLDILNLFLGPDPHIDDCFVRDDIDWMQRSQPITFVKDILFEEVVAIRWYVAAIPREDGRKPTGCSRCTCVVVIVLQRAQTGKRIAGVIRIRPPTWHLSARPASQTFCR